MDDFSNYETYVYIGSKKLTISVNTSLSKKIYYEELPVNDHSENRYFELLDQFLNQNIFKIEKKFQNFVEKINIILDLDVFFSVELSIKNNNYNDYIDLENIISEQNSKIKALEERLSKMEAANQTSANQASD